MRFDFFKDYPLVGNVLSTVILVVIGILAVRIATNLLRQALERTKLEKAAHSLILSLTRVVLYLLVAMSAASQLGIDTTGVVALASVLTLGFSLALQDIVANVIGGFVILYNQPFHSGDFVEISGQSGTVEEINMTYTILSTPDNKRVALPNKGVVAAQIVNYTVNGTRRVNLEITASYDSPVNTVLEALVEAGTIEAALPDPAPCAMVMSYGESAIAYTLRLWVKSEDYWDAYFLTNRRVKEIFDEKGLIMTYPHLNVHLDR